MGTTEQVECPACGHSWAEATHPQISPREREILILIGGGRTTSEIAKELSIAEGTVKSHLQDIFSKLKCRTRAQAVLQAMIDGHFTADDVYEVLK